MANTKKTNDKGPVTIQLPYIEGQDTEYVGYNGVGYQIKRGMPVEVPFGVAAILAASNKQMMIARENAERLANQNAGEM